MLKTRKLFIPFCLFSMICGGAMAAKRSLEEEPAAASGEKKVKGAVAKRRTVRNSFNGLPRELRCEVSSFLSLADRTNLALAGTLEGDPFDSSSTTAIVRKLYMSREYYFDNGEKATVEQSMEARMLVAYAIEKGILDYQEIDGRIWFNYKYEKQAFIAAKVTCESLVDAVSSKYDANAMLALKLLVRGANPDGTGGVFTPLAMALQQKDNLVLVKVLLIFGANANMADLSGRPPLHQACEAYYPNIKVVELLLEYGAGINDLDKDHRTALYVAATGNLVQKHWNGDDVTQLLLRKGADHTLLNSVGHSVLLSAWLEANAGHLAYKYRERAIDVLRALREFGVRATPDVLAITTEEEIDAFLEAHPRPAPDTASMLASFIGTAAYTAANTAAAFV